MTMDEICCYELAYQIRLYLDICRISESQFAEAVSIPCKDITHFLIHQQPDLSIAQISQICDMLHISLDSLVRGPVEERNFSILLKKCALVGKWKGTVFYDACLFFLKRWQRKNISSACLDRYTQWFIYFCSTDETSVYSNECAFRAVPSTVCFTRKISEKKAEKLKQIIEVSKKK